uniref:SFRICE_030325 n=1 Tax=Spodoptera frugiperda TaxID=7108 RepID=A0A2H1V0E4_SPOFR
MDVAWLRKLELIKRQVNITLAAHRSPATVSAGARVACRPTKARPRRRSPTNQNSKHTSPIQRCLPI